MGLQVTEGLGAGSKPEVGRAAAEEAIEEIRDHLAGAHMVFVTAGMGGGTGTGAAPVVARVAREMGILTVGVVTKPFQFEGGRRMRLAEGGIAELQKSVDTLIIIPNQNLFRVANEKTTFADAFAMADQVLYSGVACITDLMVKEGLINLDFADVRSIMSEMGKAMMGTGEASGDRRAVLAAEAAIANPLLDEVSMKGARGLLISITGGNDLTLYEVDEAASRIRQEVDEEANIILGATFDSALDGVVRVSVVATGIDQAAIAQIEPANVQPRPEAAARARAPSRRSAPRVQAPAAGRSAERRSAGHDGDVQQAGARRRLRRTDRAASAKRKDGGGTNSFRRRRSSRMVRAARMPQIEDLPPVGAAPDARPSRRRPGRRPRPETRRRSLLEKLAAFGISRHEEEPPPAPIAAPTGRPRAAPAAVRRALRFRPISPAAPADRRARRPGALDPHGRPSRARPVSRTTSSKSRRSCAANPTESGWQANGRGSRAG